MQSQVFRSRWIAQQHEPRHAWLDDDAVTAAQAQDNALPYAFYGVDFLPDLAIQELLARRRRHNRTPRARTTFDGHDFGADNPQDPPPHRFDFGQFGHEKQPFPATGTETPRSIVATVQIFQTVLDPREFDRLR
jgi:hypothetical protein